MSDIGAARYSRSVSSDSVKSRSRSVSRSRSRSGSPAKHKHRHHHKRHRSSHRRKTRSRSRSRSRERRYSGGGGGGRRTRYSSRSRSPMSERRRHMGDRERPNSSRCLGVFGLSLNTSDRDLRDIFGKYGPLESANVVYDKQSGRSRGFGFVYFRETEDAIEAKDQCAGIEFDGRTIRVDFSITQRAHTPTPGVYLGRPTSGYSRRSPEPYGRNYYRTPSPY